MEPLTVYYEIIFLSPPPRSCTLFPYTTLFRSPDVGRRPADGVDHVQRTRPRVRREVRVAARPQCHRRRDAHRRLLGPCRRSEEHTSELQSRFDLVCRLLLEKKTDT